MPTLATRRAPAPQASIGGYEDALSELFADLAELFGNPRSYGSIYGLLFASESPWTMDEIVIALGISKGSASMGLRQLEEFGAVVRDRTSTAPSRYTARLEMRLLIGGFLRGRVIPRISSTGETIRSIRHQLEEDGAPRTALQRIDRLDRWHKKARTILPLIEKLLSGP